MSVISHHFFLACRTPLRLKISLLHQTLEKVLVLNALEDLVPLNRPGTISNPSSDKLPNRTESACRRRPQACLLVYTPPTL
jgi:hypothetical protein